MQLNEATQRQVDAANPAESVWLSANAGSGKTRVLTDRVARLLLDGVQPQNILCLTYTKAAASEMQNRLFRRLGDWAMKPDAELAQELALLGVSGLGDPDRLAEARRLFARAIETPGGLRIQTIHSFCSSLLRRFPLEAGVTPDFSEMDDRNASLLRGEILQAMAEGEGTAAVDAIAAHYSGDDLDRLTAAIVHHREALLAGADTDTILGWFDLAPGYDMDEALEEAFDGSEGELFAALLPVLRASDKVTDQKAAARLAGFDWTAPGVDALEELISLMLFGEKAKAPFGAKIGSFPTKASRDALGEFTPKLEELMLRIEAVRGRLFSLYAAQKTAALYQFAGAFLPAYETRKQAQGWLDFDDLILRTRDLLSNDLVASWVLYRLDGGLDHILVDEAQDTSPVQWQVIERLAQEFTSGLGARDDVIRTIFVVGDKKQSIYSFQGADPREFDRMRDHFGAKLGAVGAPLLNMELEFSFRSSDAVLRFVDQAAPIGEMRHRAFRDALPGRVDLWPPVPVTEKPEKQNWYDPIDTRADDHHDVILARQIAEQIDEMIETETIPAENGARRPVRAGDILILVRRRSDLFEEIIRACKARGLPVAGADRLKLGAELAVKDLTALLGFLATPEDDLSLAAILRSPLFGWDEARLYDLAQGRDGFLWTALRNRQAEFGETVAVLSDLRDQADYQRPYDLIERILIRHDGRRRLLSRLGPEAEDGIDALLTQSLAYEQTSVPSLTGFLTWLEADEVEIKRQMDTAGDLIRVMTVHGAKGLEAPVVILPDTAKRRAPSRNEIVPLGGDRVAWGGAAARQPDLVKQSLTRLKTAQVEEEERLFYVAVTRAETWLIIAAAGETGSGSDSWHARAEEGLQQLGSLALDTPTGPGLRLQHLDWAAGELRDVTAPVAPQPDLPGWAGHRADPAPHVMGPLAPSDLGGAKALAGPDGQDEEAALRHGTQVHRLLELLPALPQTRRRAAAEALTPGAEAAIDEALAVLDNAGLGHLFAPGVLSEVDIAAFLPDLGRGILGAIDKLLVEDGRVLAVDFKTNAAVPARAEDVPEGVLRQMGAYHAALTRVYLDRVIETAILWTRTGQLMPLPHEIVRDALRRAATS